MQLLTFSLELKDGDDSHDSGMERNVALQADVDEATAVLDSMKNRAGCDLMVERSEFRQERDSASQ